MMPGMLVVSGMRLLRRMMGVLMAGRFRRRGMMFVMMLMLMVIMLVFHGSRFLFDGIFHFAAGLHFFAEVRIADLLRSAQPVRAFVIQGHRAEVDVQLAAAQA